MGHKGNKCRLMSMFWLTTLFFFVEIIVGYVTNSMALVADSFHMLSDVAALIIAYLSVKMSPKKWSKNTFGWARAEVLGALVNAVFLVALCFSISVEACKRFIEIEPIHDPQLIVVVGSLGLVVNVIGLFLFHGHGHSHGHTENTRLSQVVENDEEHTQDSHEPVSHGHSHEPSQMNMRGVFLHVAADALGSVIVIISALIVWLTDIPGKYYFDPALSLILVALILKSVWPLLQESALILLQTVPTHIQVDAIERRLLDKVDGILAVHEFHVWQLAGDRIIASAHIKCRNLSEYMKLAEKVKQFFHNEGIHSTTIQPEFLEIEDESEDRNSSIHEVQIECSLDCPKTNENETCGRNKCCGPQEPKTSPNLCRQRLSSSNSINRIQELPQEEDDDLLEASISSNL